MTDTEFLKKFEGCLFTSEDWTHEAHIRTACLYAKDNAFEEALNKVREGIKKLNSVIGVKKRGYHESITVFYMALVYPRVEKLEKWHWKAFKSLNPDLLDPSLLYSYYSEEVLSSRTAIVSFVKPDKQEFLSDYLSRER